jgi:LmbE family N-acetylglucosaminyl deacetylase
MRVIDGRGTPEGHWLPWLTATDLPDVVPPTTRDRPRALVLAAHPDDEVLAAGGLLRRLSGLGWQVDVVWASDGEGSHPGSTAVTPAELARRRRAESMTARGVLGLDGTCTWLGLPDSGLLARTADLERALDREAVGADLLLAPWRGDGHPDHEACGRAAAQVARRLGRPLWELPIWAWHWGEAHQLAPRWPHARAVHLDTDEQAAKAAAVQAFTSQVEPLGDAPEDAPVLPPWVLARFARPVEVVLCTEAGTSTGTDTGTEAGTAAAPRGVAG